MEKGGRRQCYVASAQKNFGSFYEVRIKWIQNDVQCIGLYFLQECYFDLLNIQNVGYKCIFFSYL